MYIHKSRWTLGQVLFIDLATERLPGRVVAVIFGSAHWPVYRLTWANRETSDHAECELCEIFTPDFGGTEFELPEEED